MRIYYDPIKFRDWYRVVRKGNNVYIRWVADGNTTFPWPTPGKDGYLVHGFTIDENAPRGAWNIAILNMALHAIQQAQGVGNFQPHYRFQEDQDPEYDPCPGCDTLEEEKAARRALIKYYLNWIPELEVASDGTHLD